MEPKIKHINTDQAIDLLLQDKVLSGNWINDSDELTLYNKSTNICLNPLLLYELEELSASDFYTKYTNIWQMPEKYKCIDVKEYVYNKCNTSIEQERAILELEYFEERKLFPLLQFLIFLVDYFREHKYIWGVGRGSSVSSYVLYLIGIHKINSIKYELDIKEFLK